MTEDDLNSIAYFWKEKGDVTRWCDWGKRKEEIRKTRPDIVHWVEQLELDKRSLTLAIDLNTDLISSD